MPTRVERRGQEGRKVARPVAGSDDDAVGVGVAPSVLQRGGHITHERGDDLLAIGVVAQTEGVERGEFLAEPDEVDLDDGGPRVECQFGGDVSGKRLGALRIASQRDHSEMLQVHEAKAVIVLADGHEHRVRREHVATLGHGLAEAE